MDKVKDSLKVMASLMMFSKLIAADKDGVIIEGLEGATEERRGLSGDVKESNSDEGFMEVVNTQTSSYRVEEPDDSIDYQYFIENPQVIRSLPAEEQREIRERLAAYFEIEGSLQELKKRKNEIDAEEAKLAKDDFEGRIEQQRRIEELRQSVAYQERERQAALRSKELENMERFVTLRKAIEERTASSSLTNSHSKEVDSRKIGTSYPTQHEDLVAAAKNEDSCDFGIANRAHAFFSFIYNLLPSLPASSNFPRLVESHTGLLENPSNTSKSSEVDRIFGGTSSGSQEKKKTGTKKGGVAKIFGDEEDEV